VTKSKWERAFHWFLYGVMLECVWELVRRGWIAQ